MYGRFYASVETFARPEHQDAVKHLLDLFVYFSDVEFYKAVFISRKWLTLLTEILTGHCILRVHADGIGRLGAFMRC